VTFTHPEVVDGWYGLQSVGVLNVQRFDVLKSGWRKAN